MPKAENSDSDDRHERSILRSPFAILVIGGIILSFLLGVFFFWTIATDRRGTPIPIDAKPYDAKGDAGVRVDTQ